MKNLKKIENELSENELIARAQQGDVWARNQVIEMNMPLVRKIASKSIQKSALSDSDLIQEGIFGLVTAIEKFDISLGFKFATYATWWVKQAMFKAISEQSYALNIPVYIQETMSRYNKTKQEMEQKQNKEVTKKEVAKKMNLTEEKIDTFLNCFNRALSIEQGTSITENKELTLAEIIEDEKQNVERQVIDVELKKDIKKALESLKEKEKNVIVLRFGLENQEKRTLEEIGNSYGVTKECIRQIEKRALNKMAQEDISKVSLISYIK
ncbi:MAG: sigma-70 family RNA polymerase sigma factor [Candidatus Gastranaerophilales bacterium]|nr:sigma-70 family RNA polymerase sigma factor [Candidatus Gastranaerophilales bacterium]